MNTDPRDLGKLHRNKLSDADIKAILKPVDSKKGIQYPVNPQKRRYNPEWEDRFPWLRYSESEDGAYCSCCFTFANASTSNDPLVSAPFKDWKNAIGAKRGILTNHELTKCHRSSMVAAENFMLVARKEKESIKESLNRSYSETVQKNRDTLCSILDVVILLAKRGIPFRGRWDKSAKRDNGNFEYFIHWLAKYDNNLSDHLSSAAKNARYLSPQVQNEMIDCLGEVIRSTLVSNVNQSKFISIMADETTDVSTIEQLSVCVRYLGMSSATNKVEVDEVFLGFVPLPRTDAATISDLLINHLVKWGVDLERLRGMGFDGASVMSGVNAGVQARITARFPKAKYFTHCSSHCLNLVIVASCNDVCEISNFMTTFQQVTLFFSYSAKRKDILKEKMGAASDAEELVADCTLEEHEKENLSAASNRECLPTLSDTRWLSRVDSISTLLVNYSAIYDSVSEVMLQSTGKASHDASAFLRAMEQFHFIISAVLTQYILGYTRPLSVLLQSKSCDLIKAHDEARHLVSVLNGVRSEEKFKMLFDRAATIAKTIDVLPSKPRTTGRQAHRANARAESIEEFYRYLRF